MTVEEVRGSLDLTDNGAIKNSIRNCLTVFQNDPVLQGAVRYNILTERIDIVKPLWWSKQTATLTDTDLNYLMLYLEDAPYFSNALRITYHYFKDYHRELQTVCANVDNILGTEREARREQQQSRKNEHSL